MLVVIVFMLYVVLVSTTIFRIYFDYRFFVLRLSLSLFYFDIVCLIKLASVSFLAYAKQLHYLILFYLHCLANGLLLLSS